MIVLGLNAFGHDAAAVLLVDGRVAFASSEERFDRVRHSAAFPAEALAAALAHAGLRRAQVDAIAFPWTRGMARWRKAWHVLRGLPRSRAYFRDPPDALLPDRRGYLRAMRGLETRLRAEGFRAPLVRIPHHQAHAASAALALPQGTGAVLTADGMGEWTTAATWQAAAHAVVRRRRAVYPHSPGKAYAAVTQWLGFRPESDEGKTMGLAAYGTEDGERTRAARALLRSDAARVCRVALGMFGYPWGEARLFGDAFVARFGAPREADLPLRPGDADVARGIQEAVETWGIETATRLRRATGATSVGAAGGLFLNCAMNGRVRAALAAEASFRPFPVAGDAGAAWGAAAEVHRRRTGAAAEPLGTLRLGHEIGAAEAARVGRREGLRHHEDPAALADEAARRVAAGEILAVARGRAEFGPRALGGRSVLASPTTRAARDRVNALKGREAWRPVAPIIRRADAHWFEDLVDSPYMILTFRASARARAEIPGVIHEDGSARVQTVTADEEPFVHALLDALAARGHPPVVINTSLNRRGEPIVNTAEQAWRAARAMRLDGLVLGDWISAASD